TSGLPRPLRGGNRVGGRARAGIFITRSDEYSPGVRLCAPGLSTSLGLLTLNALTTATEVYIPLQTEFLALQGLSKLLHTADIVKKRLNPKLTVTGIIGTRYDHRKKLSKEVVEKIHGYFGALLFPTLIRDNIALAEAPSFGQDIFTYRPHSHGAEDYRHLC